MNAKNTKILEIIKKAGEIMRAAKMSDGLIHSKAGTFNFVTEYDSKIQRFLEDELSALYPDAVFFAEEDGEDKSGLGDGYTFIIDPIDGTSNFIHGYSDRAISIGLLYRKEPYFGAVYLPYTDELFYAEKDCGAYLNGERIRVSEKDLGSSLTAFGTCPYDRDRLGQKVMDAAYALFMHSVDIRRCGSAASDLCSVACGRLGCFCELILSPWDFAAGSLIVTEAGGSVTRFDGSPITYSERCPVLASNAACRDEITALLSELK